MSRQVLVHRAGVLELLVFLGLLLVLFSQFLLEVVFILLLVGQVLADGRLLEGQRRLLLLGNRRILFVERLERDILRRLEVNRYAVTTRLLLLLRHVEVLVTMVDA